MQPTAPTAAPPSTSTPRKVSLTPAAAPSVAVEVPQDATAAAPARKQRSTIAVKQGFSPAQMEEFKLAFDVFDADSSGSISATELGNVFKSLGQKMMPSDLAKIVAECDADGDGTIDFDEFTTMMARKMKGAPNTEEEMREVSL